MSTGTEGAAVTWSCPIIPLTTLSLRISSPPAGSGVELNNRWIGNAMQSRWNGIAINSGQNGETGMRNGNEARSNECIVMYEVGMGIDFGVDLEWRMKLTISSEGAW